MMSTSYLLLRGWLIASSATTAYRRPRHYASQIRTVFGIQEKDRIYFVYDIMCELEIGNRMEKSDKSNSPNFLGHV